MKTMKWLLLREYWENKGSFLWAPVVIALIMSTVITALLILGFSTSGPADFTVNGVHHSFGAAGAQATVEQKNQLAEMMANGYMFIAAPIYLIFSFIAFFYCLSSLYDERRDRSILFWKSLPISDSMTVLSKVATAAGVAPLIAIVVATITSLFLLLVFSIALVSKGVNVFGTVFTSPSVYLAPIQLVALIPVYLLWALPTIGWLMMVSSWARSKVFLWAVGAPVMSLALMAGANYLFQFHWKTSWYFENIVARGLFGIIPGSWFSHAGRQPGDHAGTTEIFMQSWATLASPDLWIGVAAGAAMIYVAINMRRWRAES